jgi:transposase InsO family protein
MVEQVKKGNLTQVEAADKYGIHRNTVAKWVEQVTGEGNWLCLDTRPCPKRYRVRVGLRKLELLEERIKRRLAREKMLYVRKHPGELVHIDTKKLPKLEGETSLDSKEYLFVAVDDTSRTLHSAILPDKTDESAAAFLEEVLEVSPYMVRAVMTDNGKEYRGKLERGHAFETILDQQNIKHVYTKVRTPKTNGKAERVIRTIMTWYRKTHFTDRLDRNYQLTDYTDYYNTQKPHASLAGQTPLDFLADHIQHCELCTQCWQN